MNDRNETKKEISTTERLINRDKDIYSTSERLTETRQRKTFIVRQKDRQKQEKERDSQYVRKTDRNEKKKVISTTERLTETRQRKILVRQKD